MKQIKVLTIVGTRPEAIKLAPVVKELALRASEFRSIVCATGQHREMLDQVLSVFQIVPDHDLNLMSPGQSLSQITARAIEALNPVMARELPDVVLVQGDTTTAFCGALVAYYHKRKVGHVEAGLRTGDKFAPFPEEINRRLVAPITDYHFAPTDHARAALLGEGVSAASVFVTGNTVIDALLWVREQVNRELPALPNGLASTLDGRPMVLVTGHRRESFGEGFENICHAIREVADASPDVLFVYPMHLNPSVREPVNRILGGHERILLIEPLGYLSFVWLMDRATVVLTDSGGVQEEAPSLGKPVLVMRETTERPEGIAAGNARLVGVKRENIASGLLQLLRNPTERTAMTAVGNPYGDGKAAVRIVDVLASEAFCWKQ
ncbi:MAG: UDP-N-acetylglucosamine 2-epimerase (non-hydrolyzing) [Verrucomicrobia bacterium]|nr:UDP-N-acetylglucosamine 2-epimerase (non-hydrolyzing) [Verrucomicrobiota bacterium]